MRTVIRLIGLCAFLFGVFCVYKIVGMFFGNPLKYDIQWVFGLFPLIFGAATVFISYSNEEDERTQQQEIASGKRLPSGEKLWVNPVNGQTFIIVREGNMSFMVPRDEAVTAPISATTMVTSSVGSAACIAAGAAAVTIAASM